MKIEELFIGAIVRYLVTNYPVCGINEQDQVLIGGSWIHYSNIEPVPITPEILLMLEGENGERFELNRHRFFIKNNSVRLVMDNVVRYWHSHYVQNMPITHTHELQTRVRLDAGIVLNLKQK